MHDPRYRRVAKQWRTDLGGKSLCTCMHGASATASAGPAASKIDASLSWSSTSCHWQDGHNYYAMHQLLLWHSPSSLHGFHSDLAGGLRHSRIPTWGQQKELFYTSYTRDASLCPHVTATTTRRWASPTRLLCSLHGTHSTNLQRRFTDHLRAYNYYVRRTAPAARARPLRPPITPLTTPTPRAWRSPSHNELEKHSDLFDHNSTS
jgi:hypothetical protein